MLKITKGNVKPVFYQLNIKHSGNYNELNSDEKDSLKKYLPKNSMTDVHIVIAG